MRIFHVNIISLIELCQYRL